MRGICRAIAAVWINELGSFLPRSGPSTGYYGNGHAKSTNPIDLLLSDIGTSGTSTAAPTPSVRPISSPPLHTMKASVLKFEHEIQQGVPPVCSPQL